MARSTHRPHCPIRLAVPLASALIALAVAPAADAHASRAHGTVLLVSGHNRQVELVGAADAVRGYRYGARFPAVGFGTKIAFRAAGNHLTQVRVLGRASRVSFYARVSSSAGGRLAIRLADGRRLSFSPGHLSEPGTPPKAGETVLLMASRAAGGLRVVVETVGRQSSGGGHKTGPGHGTGGGNPNGTGPTGPTGQTGPTGGTHPIEPHSVASGVVTDIGSDSITLQLPDGSTLSPTLPAASIAYLSNNVDLSDCETLTVDYSTGAAGPVLDAFAPTGISTDPISESLGDTCADESDDAIDVVGTITALSSTSLTLAIPGQASQSYSVDPALDLPDSNEVGDVVDVTYTQNPDSSLSASNVAYVEEYTTGTVLSVDSDAGTLSIADAITGQTDNFQDGDASLSGLTPGEDVGVDYYVTGGQPQADDVESLGG
jgi:hypothetical protein